MKIQQNKISGIIFTLYSNTYHYMFNNIVHM